MVDEDDDNDARDDALKALRSEVRPLIPPLHPPSVFHCGRSAVPHMWHAENRGIKEAKAKRLCSS